MGLEGIVKLGSMMESRYAYESDIQLREDYEAKRNREVAIDELEQATHISELQVLNELVDCGVRADSLNVITLVPLVWVAWAKGYVERTKRLAILDLATESGMSSDSTSYQLLNEWLQTKPAPLLVETWQDYVGAIGRFVTKDTLEALASSTLMKATLVAQTSCGGYFSSKRISAKEQAVLNEIQATFDAS